MQAAQAGAGCAWGLGGPLDRGSHNTVLGSVLLREGTVALRALEPQPVLQDPRAFIPGQRHQASPRNLKDKEVLHVPITFLQFTGRLT